MAKERTFETEMEISVADGSEYYFALVIFYELHPGSIGTDICPPEMESVEITDVRFSDGSPLPKWLEDKITSDTNLETNILCHAMEIDAAEADDAAEWAEQSRRDQLMGGF